MTRKRRKTRTRQRRAAIQRKIGRAWERRLRAVLYQVIERVWAEKHQTATPWAIYRTALYGR